VENEWINYLSSQVGFTDPSLDLIATLTIVENGSLNVYTYYNNILFNPYNITYSQWYGNNNNSWFNGTNVNPSDFAAIKYPRLFLNTNIYFNLKDPTISIKISSFNTNDKVIPAGLPGGNPGTYYIPVEYTNLTGPLPLIGVHINYPSAQSQLVQGGGFVGRSATLNLNSNIVIYSTSSESYKDLMSTTPSLSKNAPFIMSINGYGAYPLNFAGGNSTRTTAITYITNTTYEIIHYNIFQDTGNQWIYIGNATQVKITNIYTSNGFYVESGWFPIALNDVLQNLSLPSISIGSLAPTKSIQGYNVWDDEQGFSNAANAYKAITGALETFSTSLDLGMAIITTLDAIGMFGDDIPAVVAESIKLVTSTTALAAKILSDFSSISFLSDTSITGFSYSVSNAPIGDTQGSTFNLSDYQSVNMVSFYDPQNGETYYFYAPLNYITAS